MARKQSQRSSPKNGPSRREQFRKQQRRSWLRFLVKMSLFVVPILLGTAWLVISLLNIGQTLPILTLDYTGNSTERANKPIWDRVNFTATPNSIDLQRELKLGGPDRDAVIVFCEILGDVRRVDGADRACVFVPSDQEELLNQSFKGLIEEETSNEAEQWVTVDRFLEQLVARVKETHAAVPNPKVIFAFDLRHPDLPARMPPQANGFVRQCKQDWESFRDALNSDCRVFLWLSHNESQMSYLHSDPGRVGTFFKRRLELALTGDIVKDLGKQDIYYSDLKSYLDRWVAVDSEEHKLAQSPVFLEPSNYESQDDAFLLQFQSSQTNASLGQLFDYRQRDSAAAPDDQWAKMRRVARQQNWSLENPLHRQRAYLLLLQLERLWLHGHHETELFRTLNTQVANLLDRRTSVAPFRHSLHDAAGGQEDSVETFDLTLLEKVEAGDDAEQQRAAQKLNQQRQEQLVQWRNRFSDWRGAMSVWQSLVTLESRPLTPELIERAVGLMDSQQSNVPRSESAQQVEKLSTIPWNEIAFLQRLDRELIWPVDPSALQRYRESLLKMLQLRDGCNRFAATLEPVLSQKFARAFADLEQRRRLTEDRFFAGELSNLDTEFSGLQAELRRLANQHNELTSRVGQLEQQLLEAPHYLRYVFESLSVESWRQAKASDGVSDSMQAFSSWLASPDDGFLTTWDAVSRQRIQVMLEEGESPQLERWSSLMNSGLRDQNDSSTYGSNPLADIARMQGVEGPQAFAVSDANTLSRRLLCWPGAQLSLEMRKRIHSALANPESSIRVSKVAGEAGETHPTFDDPEVAEFLQQQYQHQRAQQWLSSQSGPIKYNESKAVAGDENYFVRLAFGAHRRYIRRNSNEANGLELLLAVNDFRSRKSDLMFQRTAADLWGTPRTSEQTAFCLAATRNHLGVMDQRLAAFDGGTEKINGSVKEVWQNSPRQEWPQQMALLERICDDFDKFTWERDQQQAENSSLATALQEQGAPMRFAVFSERDFRKLSAESLEQGVLQPASIRAETMNIYLRGHQVQLAVQMRQADPDEVALETVLQPAGRPGSSVTVLRDQRGPVNGHVTLVVDCSLSLTKASRWERAKQDVLAFLEDISQRGDIAVTMVAFGAGERFVFPEPDFFKTRLTRPAEELTRWKLMEDADAWMFRGSGQMVRPGNLESYQKAIEQLKPFGETPILGALSSALEQVQGNNQNLIVLLTDGFEFGHRDAGQDDDYSPFNDGLYRKIKAKLTGRTELVVFSYLSGGKDRVRFRETLMNEFKGQIKSKDQPRGIPVDQVLTRIEDIERLASPNKIRYPKPRETNALKRFFDDLLPKPYIHAKSNNERLFREPISYQNADRQAVLLQKQIGTTDLPQGNWSINVEFSDPKIAARGFANDQAVWASSTPLYGNENLDFVYEPFAPSFRLRSGSVTNPQRADFGGMPIQLGRAGKDLQRKPYFELVASENNVLTPSPQLAWVEFREVKDSEHRLLLQDFRLNPQVSSNVHPIEFPQFQDDLSRAEFGGQDLAMRLKLLREIPAQLWSKIQFTEENDQVVSNGQDTIQLKPEEFTPIKNLLPGNGFFRGYAISLRRSGRDTEIATYTLRVESDDQPLDRWLIQVVDEKGAVDRTVNQQTRRRYVYRDTGVGQKQLIRIEHEFRINKNRLRSATVYFAFAHVDELDEKAASINPRELVD